MLRGKKYWMMIILLVVNVANWYARENVTTESWT